MDQNISEHCQFQRGSARNCLEKQSLAFSTIAGLSLLTPLSFQLNLQLNSEHGDLASFVMNGEWAILGKAPKTTCFQFLSTFPAFSRLAVDLTLYRRPVFDTLTKVSSRAETCLGAPKVQLLRQYLHPKSVLWWLDYL